MDITSINPLRLKGTLQLSTGFSGNFSDVNLFYLPETTSERNITMGYEKEDIGKVCRLYNSGAFGKANYLVEMNTFSITDRLVSIEKADDGWNAVVADSKGKEMKIHAKVLLDGTEFGDVAKAVGVGYDLGMENGKLTGEDIAPDSAYNIVQDMTMVAILKDYGDSVDMTIPICAVLG